MYRLLSFVGQDDTDILGHFLDHYRKLGVGEFHLFIHGDWTQADLAPLRSADITIAGIVQRPFDEDMKSSTLDEYAARWEDEWLIVADADEFLELPYASLEKTIKVLRSIGLDELPSVLMPRTAADGSLPALAAGASPEEIFAFYDYCLADRMDLHILSQKQSYPLVRARAGLRLRPHLPATGRPAAHLPIRGVLHHFGWRDRLLRPMAVTGGFDAGDRLIERSRVWLQEHGLRLPTAGLRPYRRAAMLREGHLVQPTDAELARLSAFRTARLALHGDGTIVDVPETLRSVPPAIMQKDDQAARWLDRRGLLVRPGRVALVTSELIGLPRSGGIGTAIGALAERLAATGHELHVFLCPYAGSPSPPAALSDNWEARGVRVHWLTRQTSHGRVLSPPHASLLISEALAVNGEWDAIHLPEAGGLGAATLLHRAAGLAFQSTRIAVTVHGPSRWHRSGNFLPWTVYEAEIAQLEAISIDLADIVIFPSIHMLNWSRSHFVSPAPHLAVPNSLSGESRRFSRFEKHARRIERIVFFGRIELRKGVDRFLSAVEIVLDRGFSDFEVVFLGTLGQNVTETELVRRTGHWPCRTSFLLDYTAHQALDLLRADNCLAVMPSRVDNSPYTVYECLENGVAFIASDAGGIPELVSDADRARVLVSGDAEEYAARLIDALQNGATPALPAFDPDQSDIDLLSIHGNLVQSARELRGRARPERAANASVLVYGASALKPSLALVLRRWAQDGIEIFFHGQPSDHPSSADDLSRLAATQAAALNRLARSAAGGRLLFLHASVTPKTESLAAMLATLDAARADAVVCGCKARRNGTMDIVPVFGGPAELSTTRNVYGAKLFLVRKTTFLDVGGFAGEPETAGILEWELLNRLKAMGGRVAAIPAALVTVDSPVSHAPSQQQVGRLTAPWTRSIPDPLQGFVRMALHPEEQRERAVRGRGSEDPRLDGAGASPDVRGLELTSLLERRDEHRVRQIHSGPDAVGVSAPSGQAASESADLSTPGGAAPDAEEGTEIGRQNVGLDGRLNSQARTYVVETAADAEGSDVLVADGFIDRDHCLEIGDAFQAMERRAGIAGDAAFFRFEEILETRAVTPLLEAVERAATLTSSFYDAGTPLYPSLIKVERNGAGAFAMPRRQFPMPATIGASVPGNDFAGMFYLNDVEGGEAYFTALDLAVKPASGRYIGSNTGPYHERAMLRIESGSLLTVSFRLTPSAEAMSAAVRRLWPASCPGSSARRAG
jgi:O-antigen biosynthesis protein